MSSRNGDSAGAGDRKAGSRGAPSKGAPGATAGATATGATAGPKSIHIWGVKQNNLKNLDVEIELGAFTVICGPSGSGKSSLAFETLFAEGQRRYIESLNNYARQFLGKAPKPDIEGIANIPPAIAIEQKNTVKTSRSTVGTTTEIVDYLRLLFAKVGESFCPTYGFTVQKDSVSDATQKVLKELTGARAYILAPVTAIGGGGGRVLNASKLHQFLVTQGFQRIYLPPEAPVAGDAAAASAKAGSKKTSSKLALSKKSATKKSSSTTSGAGTVGGAAATAKSAAADAALASQGITKSSVPNCHPPEGKHAIGRVIDIKPGAAGAKDIPDTDFYVVIDRTVIKTEDEGRLADSIGQAYDVSLKLNTHFFGGRASVLTTEGRLVNFSQDNACGVCGYAFQPISTQLFSFNNPVGACQTCNGFGNLLALDESKVIPNPQASIEDGALHPFTMPSAASDRRLLMSFCKKEGIDTKKPWAQLPKADRDLLWKGNDKFFGVIGLFDYLETKKYKMHVRVFLSRYKSPFPCTSCKGSRLRPESQFVRVGKHTIGELSAMTVGELHEAIKNLKLTKAQTEVAGEIYRQVKDRLEFLVDVGVEYLTMDRPTRTLSGGEFQRLNLAKQLGMGLSQTLYVLDEPTVGLHPRDNDRLIGILKKLNDLGNTLVVVEHDHDVIRNSSRVIEMGPGSGHLGGEIIYSGPTKDFYNFKKSITAPYLLEGKKPKIEHEHRPVQLGLYKFMLELTGCRGNNLKNVDVKFPLNRLVTVTGVSGSGKSTLVSKTLYPAIAQKLEVEFEPCQPYDKLKGTDNLRNVLFIDQSPIGKSARSNPVTYLKIYDNIRNLMSSTPESKLRGYQPGTFSLNVDGGRCPVCRGLGYEIVDMMFMDDVQLTCDACDGKKFRREILEVTYKNKNIYEILNLTVGEAMDFFVAYPAIRKPLSFLKEVGLDYIRLGQSASSLSGGESQRLKIAREFISTQQKLTLYILDEPTTGLHFREIEMLMAVLNKLVESGASVILIEHNLDVIRNSDYVIDLGPEAGAAGGTIVAEGTPEEIMKAKDSLTGQYLKSYLGHSQAAGKKARGPEAEGGK